MNRSPIRWIYHLVTGTDESVRRLVEESARFAPASLLKERFIHGSFLPDVRTSGQLYFPPNTPLWAIPIDPRRVDVPIELAETPRGRMPHLHGSISRDALGAPIPLQGVPGASSAAGAGAGASASAAIDSAPDAVIGTRIAMVTRGSAGIPSSSRLTGKEPEAFDEARLGDALAARFGARVVLIPVDIDRTEARNTDFDALLFVDPSSRSWASGLPRNRRVFAASARIADDIEKWLTFNLDAGPPAPK